MQQGVEASAAALPRRHDEVGAIGGKPGVEHPCHPRGEVAPSGGCPEQHGGRVAVDHESGDDPGVRLDAVAVERLILGHEHHVDAVASQFIDSRAEVVAGNDGGDATAEGGGQFGGL